MIKGIKHIFFDLDHTLWDFEKNSSITLSLLYQKFNLKEILKISESDFIYAYNKTIRDLWMLYDQKKITKDELREARFNRVFLKHGYSNPKLASEIDDQYIEICPKQGNLMDHAIDILEYLSEKYDLHIITNGFKDIQNTKLSTSGIKHYFFSITTSECSDSQKTDAQIFSHATNKARAFAHESVMIGDNPFADILGAKKFGMKAILLENTTHFDTEGMEFVDLRIQSLIELKNLL